MTTPAFGFTATERLLSKLAIDFTTAALDSRITFTRTTGASNPATYIGNNGYVTSATNDQPRFDYDPVTLGCKGLLIEETRTNWALYSGDLTNASWGLNAVSVTGGQADPANTTTAVLLNEGTATNVHYIQSNAISCTSGTTQTQSVFVKAGTETVIQLFFASATHATTTYANFDIGNGVLGTVGDTATAKIEPFSNGWYRCSLTGTANATGSSRLFVCFTNNNVNAARVVSYLGTSKTFIATFGQFEFGAFATSYIPTTTTALTRNADVAVMTGTNFSDWWQASKGGVLVRARPSTVSGTRPLLQFDDGTVNEVIALRGNTTNPELYIVYGGTPQAQIDAGTIAANTDYSMTGWWSTNDCKARLDSGAVIADTSATIPTVTQARLGSDGTNYLNGHLASISYYGVFSQQIYTRRKNKAIFNLM